MQEIILASASERRSRILSECGIAHKVVLSGSEEKRPCKKHVSEIVMFNACLKAESVARVFKQSIIIGADTLVEAGEDVIGKPGDAVQAKKMLQNFSGKRIKVYTGLSVVNPVLDKKSSGFEKTDIVVACLTDDQVERYFGLLGPYDKAGGFSIEGAGALIFDNIKGSYFNVLGLPMMLLRNLFEEINLDIAEFVKI